MPGTYLDDRTQRRQILALSQAEQAAHAVVLEAYQQFAASAAGAIILDDLVAKVLLQPCLTPEDEGKRRLVLDMLRLIASASGRLAVLREGTTNDPRQVATG